MTARPRRPVARRVRRFAAAAVTGGLLASWFTGCASRAAQPPAPARADPVAFGAEVPAGLKIGVVLSLASAPGQGVEWRDAAEGARVAAQRFQLGGAPVTLVTADDHGTAQGVVGAVSTLADSGVAGIVLATSGDHLGAGLKRASEAGVPALAPYADDVGEAPPGTWWTGPDAPAADARLVQAVQDRGVTRPFLLDAGGGPLAGLGPSGTASFRAGDDPAALARALGRRLAKPQTAFDAVVVRGPAALQASVVQALQGAGVDVPFFLTPQALSPAFPAMLRKAEGSLSGEFVSAGLDVGEAAALQPSASGRALAGYFAALRTSAADPGLQSLLGDRPFAEVAGAADVRSHDAVVALVRAATAADSTAPADVSRRLSGLRLSAVDGLAGPELDFSAPTPLAADAVVALAATPSSPGVRPGPAADPGLSWFAMPTS
jgi:hypothetical protein